MGQAQHYDTILSDYERHYFDEPSMEYRRKLIYPLLFNGLDLNDLSVIELACASGLNSTECSNLFPRARLQGVDISPECCISYRKNTGLPASVMDLTASESNLPGPFDVAFVVGGIHHCVNDLPATMRNMGQLVKAGGYLLMVEPNAAFFLNAIREFWYRKDKWFRSEEERPLRHEELLSLARRDFELVSLRFLGGPAYFLVLNSLITRIPHRLKPLIAKPLMLLEGLYNMLPGSSPFPMFIAQWRRKNNV